MLLEQVRVPGIGRRFSVIALLHIASSSDTQAVMQPFSPWKRHFENSASESREPVRSHQRVTCDGVLGARESFQSLNLLGTGDLHRLLILF
jgi:hypothetical protein